MVDDVASKEELGELLSGGKLGLLVFVAPWDKACATVLKELGSLEAGAAGEVARCRPQRSIPVSQALLHRGGHPRPPPAWLTTACARSRRM